MRPRPRGAAVLFPLALLVLSAGTPPSFAADPPLHELFAAPVPTVSADLNVTAVLAGINLSAAEQAAVIAAVNASWWPAITSVDLPLGVNYSLHLRLVQASDGFIRAYASSLASTFANDSLGRVVGNYIGLLQNASAYFPAWTNATPVRHADAGDASKFLAAADADFPEVAAPQGEARFFFLNPYPLLEPYYYSVNSTDLDRGSNFTFETINAWGDGAGLFFQDLRAAPSHLGETAGAGRPANFAGQPPIWSYGSNATERARLVADLAHYLEASARILVAPSFVVTPFDAISLTLAVTLFDDTFAQTLFAPGGAGASRRINTTLDLLNGTLVAAAVHDLIPYSAASVRVTTANRTSDPATASALAGNVAPSGGANIFDPFGLSAALKTRWAVPGLPVQPGEAVTVPALLIITDADAWVDSANVRGVTLQRNDGRAGGIIIAAGLDQLEARGFSEALVHEAGHSLGLGHPHELGELSPNGTALLQLDWLRSLSSTPMTYLPNYVDYSFDSFDKHALWTGVAAATLGLAYQLRQVAYQRFEALGYSASNLPVGVLENESFFLSYANETSNLLSRGILYIEPTPPYSSGGAIVMAKRAYDQARDLTVLSLVSPRCCAGPGRGFLPGFDAPMALATIMGLAALSAWSLRRR